MAISSISCLFFLTLFSHQVLMIHYSVSAAVNPLLYKPGCQQQKFDCGKFRQLGFPFTNETFLRCGPARLDCSEPTPNLTLKTSLYDVSNFTSETIDVSWPLLETSLGSRNICDVFNNNINFHNSGSVAFMVSPNITLLKCYKSQQGPEEYQLHTAQDCKAFTVHYFDPSNSNNLPPGCQTITLPATADAAFHRTNNSSSADLLSRLASSFAIRFIVSTQCQECIRRGHRCSLLTSEFMCREDEDLNTKSIFRRVFSSFFFLFSAAKLILQKPIFLILLPQMSPLSHLLAGFVVFFIIFDTKTLSAEEANFTNCGLTYSCRSIQDVGYPFWGNGRPRHCGLNGFNLTCVRDEYTLMQINNRSFRLLGVNQTQPTMRIASDRMWNGVCSASDDFADSTFVGGPAFRFTLADRQINIFYDCNVNSTSGEEYSGFKCPRSSGTGNRTVSFVADRLVVSDRECKAIISFAVLKTAYQGLRSGNLSLQETLNQGFEIQYERKGESCSRCEESGGICGSQNGDQFLCFCPDRAHNVACRGSKKKIGLAVKIGASVLGVGILGVCSVIYWFRKRLFSDKSVVLGSKRMMGDQHIEDFIKHHGSLAPKRYTYSDIKKMTNSLKDKLGQGGFGSIYKGKLPDGHLVAVKILNVLKGNGEDFINEVASISRTSHVNVVTLKGYCLQGRKRALVYDFISRGSLEKFIVSETATEDDSTRLDWGTLYRITVGIARGLEYLHSGCNTRILHLDIKPHNILLHEDFCPKISDFGLAKLCTGKESIVSMAGARGTVGYIAPEVFCRNFGGVSYKSDVYSYGMMILEMVGARKKLVEGEVDGTSSTESYFPQWIYKRLETGGDLELKADMTKEEHEITKKMTMVGLWCIQTDPSQRPSMGRVLEMLEGSVERLEFPPQPFLYSPSRPPAEYSTTITM